MYEIFCVILRERSESKNPLPNHINPYIQPGGFI